jgi:hypothetical protein
MQPRYSRLVKTMLRKTRLVLSTTIVARRDTSRKNVVAYRRTRSLS